MERFYRSIQVHYFTDYCTTDGDCPPDKGCVGNVCIDPCEGQCIDIANAICYVTDHKANCTCPPGYLNYPFDGCLPGEK